MVIDFICVYACVGAYTSDRIRVEARRELAKVNSLLPPVCILGTELSRQALVASAVTH